MNYEVIKYLKDGISLKIKTISFLSISVKTELKIVMFIHISRDVRITL